LLALDADQPDRADADLLVDPLLVVVGWSVAVTRGNTLFSFLVGERGPAPAGRGRTVLPTRARQARPGRRCG
jgi:hypothetical protein